jgi:hypothetical protein
MENPRWVALLRRIPLEQQFNLMLVTNNGLEMSILSVLRIEEDFVVLRARMAGTDLGRTLFLPYDRITYLGFHKPIKEIEVRAMFGEMPPEPQPAAELKPEEPASGPPGPVPEPQATAPPVPPSSSPPRPVSPAQARSSARVPLPSKSAILERLRARSQAGHNKPR